MATFALRILNPKHVVFEAPTESVFLPGDMAEFELLAYHVPIVSLLKQGEIVIDWKTRIPIQKGMVRFFNNECVILLEEETPRRHAAAGAHRGGSGN